MNYTIAVYGDPYNSQSGYTALQFVKALLSKGHLIKKIFFYQNGVHQSNTLIRFPQDGMTLASQWDDVIGNNQLPSVVCISAAVKRGVLDQSEAQRYGCETSNLSSAHELGGLGQLIDAIVSTDRFISFGS